MAHTYGSCLYHFVFSTRSRNKTIERAWQPRLWEYIGGIANKNTMDLLSAGGMSDHCHLLLSIPPSMAPAKGIQLIKGGSSKWINEKLRVGPKFEWQEGYGVFTIGFSQIPATRNYIENQAERHRYKTFEEEYRAFLKKHMIEVNEDYVFD